MTRTGTGTEQAPSPFGLVEVVSAAAVAAVAAALIVLIWMVTARTIQDQRAGLVDLADRLLAGQASTMAEAVTQELLQIDQSLGIIQQAWKTDSDAVDLAAWKKTLPALTSVADDVFIADDKHVIRQDILPQAIGQGVGAAYVTFPHGSLEVLDHEGDGARAGGGKVPESLRLQLQAGDPVDARAYLMYLVRPLDHPRGWLVGASYRSAELARMFARASLGYNALVALVDTRQGILQTVVGPAARRPTIDLSKTPMYEALKRDDPAIWLGRSGIDDVERLHAFRRIPGRDMGIVVAASYAEVLAPANDLAIAARGVAVLASLLVAAVAGLVGYTVLMFRANHRRRRRVIRQQADLQRLRLDEAAMIARTQLQTARLQALLDHGSEGIALVDDALRVAQWNPRFALGIGVELHADMPLDAVIREQASRGLFETGSDPEADIARRIAALRLGISNLPQLGPRGETLYLHCAPVTEGGFLLILSGAAKMHPLATTEGEGTAQIDPVFRDRAEANQAYDEAARAPIEW